MLKTKILKIIIFTLVVLGVGTFLNAEQAHAATYYVDKDCNATTYLDNGAGGGICTGGNSMVFNTIQAALNYNSLTSGDIIKVQAGTYNESVTVNKAGITLQGTLDVNGHRLSIIDPYVNVSGDWTLTGSGIYTKNVGWQSWAMVIEVAGTRYKVPRLCHADEGTACNSWQTYLAWAPNASIYPGGEGYPNPINPWKGMEILNTFSSGGTAYVSFKDDDNVSEKTLYVTSRGDNTITMTSSNVTIKDFEIRAKKYGIYSTGQSNITIDNNKLIFGRTKIYLEGNGHTITNNEATDQNYAESYVGTYTRGAWQTSDAALQGEDLYSIKHWLYTFVKRYSTDNNGQVESSGIWVYGNPSSNITISNNELYGMDLGININIGDNVKINNNIIRNMSSVCIAKNTGTGSDNNIYIHDNSFSDCNAAIRFQDWEKANNSTKAKIYGNRSWLPRKVGGHVYFHYIDGQDPEINTLGEVWFYHNSFSGGREVIGVSSTASQYTPSRGTEKIYMINNIMSTQLIYYDQSNVAWPGGCWYSWLAGDRHASSHSSNINNGLALMWDPPENPDFTNIASTAINAGKDISQSFTIDGKTHPALPGYSPGYFTGTKPNMGAVQSGEAQAAMTYFMDSIACTGNYSIANRNCTGSDGTSFTTLSAFNSVAVAGDILNIRSGTYSNQTVYWTKSGTSGNVITIKNYPGETPIFDGTNTTERLFFLIDNNHIHHVVIDGLEIKRYTYYAIFLLKIYDITIKNSNIHNNGLGGRSAIAMWDTSGDNSHNITIENNTFVDNGYTNCTQTPHAIYLSGGIRNSTIRNNTFSESTYCSIGIIKIGLGGANTPVDNHDIDIYNNIFYRTSGTQKYWGPYLTSPKINFYNNTLYTDCAGTTSGCSVIINSSSGGNVKNNIFYTVNPDTNDLMVGSSATEDYNLWYPAKDSDDTGSNSKVRDPLFENEAAKNFALKLGSNAINAGTTIALVDKDIIGITRPQPTGGAYDIGAYEYSDGGNPADVNRDGQINIKDIHACIKVIAGTDLTYKNQCQALAAPADKANIKDIQAIIKKIINPN